MNISELPKDVQTHILQGLPVNDILQYCQSNKSISQLCHSQSLWSVLLQRDYKKLPTTRDARSEYVGMLLKEFASIANQEAMIIMSDNNYTNSGLFMDDYNNIIATNSFIQLPPGQVAQPDIRYLHEFKRHLTDYWYWSRLALSALGYDTDTYMWMGNKIGYDFANLLDVTRKSIAPDVTDIQMLIRLVNQYKEK